MKIVCDTCGFESIAVRFKTMLPLLIVKHGGFVGGEGGLYCPNGHLSRVESTGRKGTRRLPGMLVLPRKGTNGWRLLKLIRRSEEITVEDLTMQAWYEWPELFGLPGHTMASADSNKVQSVLSHRGIKELLEIPSSRTYRLTPEAKELWDNARERDTGTEQGGEAGGRHPARNGSPHIERPVRPGGVGRIVGRPLRDELAPAERGGSGDGQ